ncbi:transcriptional regulator, TraR/DksA family, partial [sediment metagenome]
GNDADENASEVDIYTTNIAMEETLEKELRDVRNSLKRIADGKYGICKFCKKTIEVARLKIRPTSASCVACKQKLQDNPDKSIQELFGNGAKE